MKHCFFCRVVVSCAGVAKTLSVVSQAHTRFFYTIRGNDLRSRGDHERVNRLGLGKKCIAGSVYPALPAPLIFFFCWGGSGLRVPPIDFVMVAVWVVV